MSFWTAISQLRTILSTETNYDSPNSEELLEQLRENIEALFMLLFDTADSGSATSDPPDNTTGVLTDTGAAYDVNEHQNRTLLITSGAAIGNLYTIDANAATSLTCTGDNLYADGVRSGDTYKILYDVKVNADGHDHDGINSKSAVLADNVITQAKMADSAIGQAELKSTTQSQDSLIGSGLAVKFDLTGGTYCFKEQTYGSTAAVTAGNKNVDSGQGNTSYTTSVWLSNDDVSVTRTGYVQQRYVQASGEVYWLFIRRDKISKKIIGVSACADHPCFGNGGKPLLRPHPFTEYDPDTQEIICINPTKAEVKAMWEATEVEAEDQPDRDLTDVIREDYEIDELSNPEWPKEAVTVALPPDWNEAWLERRKVTPIKKVIPQPDDVIVRSLKKKAEKL